ncbi:hypothetical protein BS78_K076800 [Paspalum vaginatum]|uniref:Uncharacterized protein n=1 Tax=Paspalum vaginatum TaxID=158149 RepID=A0A9W7XCM3_9POAL|nr:hypothetical protein BS78_K076800 [Paspalum vaginatum]
MPGGWARSPPPRQRPAISLYVPLPDFRMALMEYSKSGVASMTNQSSSMGLALSQLPSTLVDPRSAQPCAGFLMPHGERIRQTLHPPPRQSSPCHLSPYRCPAFSSSLAVSRRQRRGSVGVGVQERAGGGRGGSGWVDNVLRGGDGPMEIGTLGTKDRDIRYDEETYKKI